jgi:predicted lipid-binding transport protein (Tim44 family)
MAHSTKPHERVQVMRGIFSGLSLLLVLAVIGFAAMRQFKAADPAAAAGATAAATRGTAGPAQAAQIQEQVRADVNKALEQGAARNEAADK